MTEVRERVVDRARGMRDLVRSEAAESERLRTLTPATVDAMWASGLMPSFNPAAAGGEEPSFQEMIETWIEMAWQDGSFGWIGIANLPSAFAAATYLPDDGFAEVFTANDNHVALGGQFFPNGQGAVVDGGFRITGAWSFGSGTGHSDYIAAGFMPMEDGQARWISEGVPELRVAFIPRDEITFTDGWHVQGLKGTGSYDYNCQDVFVPECRTMPLFTREPFRGNSAAGRMGLMVVTAAGHASWALGVAKSMLDDVEEQAVTKVRMSDMATLATRPTFQKDLAHHVAAWRAARLLVLDAFSAAEDAITAGDDLTPRMRADMRGAAVYATDVARAGAEWAHLAAGTTSIREGSRLERAFRDMYTGTQHAFISEKVAIDVAQIWLGVVSTGHLRVEMRRCELRAGRARRTRYRVGAIQRRCPAAGGTPQRAITVALLLHNVSIKAIVAPANSRGSSYFRAEAKRGSKELRRHVADHDSLGDHRLRDCRDVLGSNGVQPSGGGRPVDGDEPRCAVRGDPAGHGRLAGKRSQGRAERLVRTCPGAGPCS